MTHDKETKNGIRIMAILGLVVLGAIVFAGCGGDDFSEDPASVKNDCVSVSAYRTQFANAYKGVTECQQSPENGIDGARLYCVAKDAHTSPLYIDFYSFYYKKEGAVFVYDGGTLVGISGNAPSCLKAQYPASVPSIDVLKDKWNCTKTTWGLCK